jgi:hypothetical protein
LVNETLGAISPSSLAVLGPKAAQERLQGALDSANKVMMNAASARNYRPKSSESPGVQVPKKGEERKGYIFLGGDPSKPESWAKANS